MECISSKIEFTRHLEYYPIAKVHYFPSNFNFARVFIASKKKKWNSFCEFAKLLINVQLQHRIFWLQLRICQIHFLLLIEPLEILLVLGSISSYKHNKLLRENSVYTLWVRLLAIIFVLNGWLVVGNVSSDSFIKLRA